MKKIRVAATAITMLMAGTLLLSGCGTASNAAASSETTTETAATQTATGIAASISPTTSTTVSNQSSGTKSTTSGTKSSGTSGTMTTGASTASSTQVTTHAIAPSKIPAGAVKKTVKASTSGALSASSNTMVSIVLPSYVPTGVKVEKMFLDIKPVVGTNQPERVVPVTDYHITSRTLTIAVPHVELGHYLLIPEFTGLVKGSMQLFVITAGVNLTAQA
ncbi:MAG: hypothetical protein OWR52_00280 [Acidibacillus sp.]|nr:hypothetical protein [Acidibacillus sp.]